MPDICMCLNEFCPLAESCGRSELSGTKPSDRQAFADFAWRESKSGEPLCDSYMMVDVPAPEHTSEWIKIKENGEPLWKFHRGWWGVEKMRITEVKIDDNGIDLWIKVGKR